MKEKKKKKKKQIKAMFIDTFQVFNILALYAFLFELKSQTFCDTKQS